jgi:excisionase family DNA binding protein
MMEKTTATKRLLSTEEASVLTGLKPVTLRLHAALGKIASVKLGRRVMIPADEIERLISENYRPRRGEGAGASH